MPYWLLPLPRVPHDGTKRRVFGETDRPFASWPRGFARAVGGHISRVCELEDELAIERKVAGSLFSDCVRWPQPLAEKIDGDRSCIWRRNPGARSTCNAAATGSLQSTAANADLVMTPAEQAREKIEALKQSPEFLKAWHARDPAALRKLQQLQLEEHQHLQA